MNGNQPNYMRSAAGIKIAIIGTSTSGDIDRTQGL